MAVVVKPLRQVVDASKLEDRVINIYGELMQRVVDVNGVKVLRKDTPQPTPSTLAHECWVAAKLHLEYGIPVSAFTLLVLAKGIAYHEAYEQWFIEANRGIEVHVEEPLVNYLGGRPDIVYYSDDSCGVVEIKSTTHMHYIRYNAYMRQLTAYYISLRDEFKKRKCRSVVNYLVTYNTVYRVTDKAAEHYVPKIEEFIRLIQLPYPTYPPYRRLCSKCLYRQICPVVKKH